MKTIEKTFWYLLAFFILYSLIGFKLISYILETQIVKNIDENLKVKSSVERIEFNPFIFKIKIKNFNINDLDNQSILNTKKVILDVDLINSISSKTILANDTLVDNLVLNIKENINNEINLLNLVKPKENVVEKNQTENESTQNTNIDFLISKFNLTNATINFTKELKENNYKIRITNINNSLKNLGSKTSEAINILTLNIDEKTSIKTETSILHNNFSRIVVNSNVNISNLDIKKLSDYKKELLKDIDLKELLLNSDFKIKYEVDKNNLQVDSKKLLLTNLDVNLNNKTDIKSKKINLNNTKLTLDNKSNINLEIKNLNINNTNVNDKPSILLKNKDLSLNDISLAFNETNKKLSIKDILISSLDFKQDKNIDVELNNLNLDTLDFDINNNFLQLGKTKLTNANLKYIHLNKKDDNLKNEKISEKVSKSESVENKFFIKTDNLNIIQSKLYFEDRTLEVPFITEITDLKGFVSKINTQNNTISDLSVNGVIDKYATANIDAKVNLNNVKILSDIDFKIKNLPIKSFTPYSKKYIAQDLDGGKLDVNLKYNIENSNLDAKNNVVITKIELGKKYEDENATSLPLGIAIALLEDTNDKIEINLPVTGNLDDPEFSIAPIVWKAFTNLILKAITAPFSLLGAIFDFGDDEINKLSFQFNETTITPIQKETLDKLVKVLTNRPNMALEYKHSYNSNLEKNKIINEKYEKFILNKPKNIKVKEYLLNYYKTKNDDKKIAQLNKDFDKKEKELLEFLKNYFKENIKVTKSEFEKIAISRSENIKQYLLKNGVKQNQIHIINEFVEETLQNESIIIEFKVNTI